jgi:alpha-tubulin suppressor-like RCC1 family protein
MNITTLTKAIEVLASSATTAQDILILSKVLERLRLGNVTAVATYIDMIALRKNTGDLVFVDGEQKLYFLAFGGAWTSIMDTALNSAWAWGYNNRGALGDNTTVTKSSPVSVVGGFTDWVQISAGNYHTVGLRANGSAWTWGRNNRAELGDGTTVSKSSPVSVVGGFTDWVQISGGDEHNVGIRTNGTAWAWGGGSSGRLGNSSTIDRSSPVSVVGGFTDWVQVETGSNHTVGVRANGTAWAWGSNTNGRLGDDTTVAKSSPVSVVGGFTDWVQLSGGSSHTVGLRSNGTAWAWGNNGSGRLGDNTTVSKRSPVSVVGGFVDWVQLSAGGDHTVGLRSNGTVWTWGSGTNGRLGDSTTVAKSSPVSVAFGFTDWVQVSAGQNHNIGLRANGTAWVWGYNTSGQLGTGTTVSRTNPGQIVGGLTDWVQVSAGFVHTAALR